MHTVGPQATLWVLTLEDMGSAADAMIALYRTKQKRGYQLTG